MKARKILGIDVGGSGIKGAIIDTKKGELLTDRERIETPQPATPELVANEIINLVKHFNWDGPVGIGMPAVVQNGIVKTAANIDKSFIGFDFEHYLSEKLKVPVKAINDADAAGLAEMKFGAGKDQNGVVLLVTVGTGIGTVVFTNRKLLPNTELGHIFMKDNREAELFTSDATRQNLDLSWPEWTARFNEYLNYMESLFWPDLIIVGGGVSKNEKKYLPMLKLSTKVVNAELKNNAGIIGAAIAAKKMTDLLEDNNS